MTTRRDILRSMGLGAAALAATVSTAARAASTLAPTARAFADGTSSSVSPWWIVAPLKVGSSVGKGWRLQALSSVQQGAARIELAHADGRAVSVHVCARQGRARGVAHTALFDLITMDGRDGEAPTPEDLGRVLVTLAKRIRANEQRQLGSLQPFSALMSHEQRVAAYGPQQLLFGDAPV